MNNARKLLAIAATPLLMAPLGCVEPEVPPLTHTSGLGSAIGSSSSAETPAPPGAGLELSVERGLPEGMWLGELSYIEFGTAARMTHYSVSAEWDGYWVESGGNGYYVGLAHVALEFLGPGSADWVDADGVFAECSAIGNTLSCATTPEEDFQLTRSLSFYEYALVWTEIGSLEGRSYERSGVLAGYRRRDW